MTMECDDDVPVLESGFHILPIRLSTNVPTLVPETMSLTKKSRAMATSQQRKGSAESTHRHSGCMLTVSSSDDRFSQHNDKCDRGVDDRDGGSSKIREADEV